MLIVDIQKPIARITLNRPELHNAFNAELIRLVTEAFTDVSTNPDVRVVILGGNGKSFCAGADLNWMKGMANYTREENIQDAKAAAGMFLAVAKCPKPVIARVHGAALGGGSGAVAASDIAIAVEAAQFGFTEVKLGIIPAVISPVVISKIGPRAAREYFITGERFPASTALSLGLVQHVVADVAALDELIDRKIAQILTSAPGAIAAAKELIFGVAARSMDGALDFTAEAIANARASQEGQDGMKAFLSREKPPWNPS
jgi:methylglutaconyl-CoA hydratase